MNNRKKRLTEVYDYVRRHYPIHTQGDFAQVVGYSRPVISSALNGNEEYLSDKFFTNICAAFPGIFSLDYLLHGTGTLLTNHGTFPIDLGTASTNLSTPSPSSSPVQHAAVPQQLPPSPPPSPSPTTDPSTLNIIDLYSHLISDLELLRRQTKDELALLRQARQDLLTTTTTLQNLLKNHQSDYFPTLAAENTENSPNSN